MGGPGALKPAPDPLRDYALAALGGFSLLLTLHAVFLPQGTVLAELPALALYALGAVVTGTLLQRHYPHGVLGWCNVVTLLRGVLTAFLLTALLLPDKGPWLVAVVGALTLSLDGVDGWLARRKRLVSRFGARFDMEVDSALALILALHALAGGTAGPVVLVLGLTRYGFVLAGLVLPWLQHPLPERFSRKAVCVMQLSTLIALQLPVLTPPVAQALALAASAALLASFARDVLWLWRRRGN